MKQFTSAMACLAVTIFAFYATSDRQPAAGQTASVSKAVQGGERTIKLTDQDVWMKAKQQHSQIIFSGLTGGDFKKIENGATLMFGAGLLEKWLSDRNLNAQQKYAYEGQSNAFDYSLKELVRHSRQKDIDGALNAYVMMSQTCVRCHQLVRDAK